MVKCLTMINFIVIEDEDVFTENITKTISSYMKNQNLKYKIYHSKGYGKHYNLLAQKDIGFKVYILDIKTKKGSGLDAAREIREVYEDWSSVILFVTAFDHYRYEALSNRLFVLDFISKGDEYQEEIINSMDKVMHYYDHRPKSISFESAHTLNKVDFRNVVCIEKESKSKNCIITTTYDKIVMPGSLIEMEKYLDDRFLRVHRALIINKDQIDSYNASTNELVFKNGHITDLVSRIQKKELKEYVVRCRV